jgi:uroporphyrinogen decarboxylase
VTVFGPFASGNHASSNLVTEHAKLDPAAVSAGLAAIADSLGEFALACVGAGAAGIYYSAQGGEIDRFTEEQFLSTIKPHDVAVLSRAMTVGEFHLLHICKDRVRLSLYADCPSHAVNWAASKHNPGLKEGQQIFQRTVVGGMDDRGVIAFGTEGEIHRAVRALVDEVGTRGFMVGADCTVPTDIPIANIRAAVQATAA